MQYAKQWWLFGKTRNEFRPALLGGLGVVTGPALTVDGSRLRPARITAIPYFAWANRGKGEMVVWLPYENKPGPTTH